MGELVPVVCRVTITGVADRRQLEFLSLGVVALVLGFAEGGDETGMRLGILLG